MTDRCRLLAPWLLVGLLVGCSGGTAAPGGAGQRARAVIATVEQDLSSQARGVLQVTFRNNGDQSFTFAEVRVVDARFEVLAPTRRDVTVPVGGRELTVPLPFGVAKCDGSVGGAAEPRIEVRGSSVEPTAVSIDDRGRSFLGRLYAAACGQQVITHAVRLGFSSFERAGNATVRGVLRLERRQQGEAITVVDVRGNVIFALRVLPSSSVPLVLAPGEQAADLPLELSASRCDPHALTGYTKTYRFRVFVIVGRQPAHSVEVQAVGAEQSLLTAALQAGCGAPAPTRG
jgi:hypothetical protein